MTWNLWVANLGPSRYLSYDTCVDRVVRAYPERSISASALKSDLQRRVQKAVKSRLVKKDKNCYIASRKGPRLAKLSPKRDGVLLTLQDMVDEIQDN